MTLGMSPSAAPPRRSSGTRLQDPPAASAGQDRSRLLAALVRDLAARTDLWKPRVHFSPQDRWWTRLPGPSGVDVWLLTWLTSQGTELHDHGESAAAFTVVRGALTETRPAGDSLTSRRIGPGQVQTIAPGGVHDVDNRSSEPAVSIHAYSPRLTRMTFYAIDGGRVQPTRTVWTSEPEETGGGSGDDRRDRLRW